jgi:hypothetical protein
MKWVTRERPKTDRIACPWLIRNFIDPEAEFLYVAAEQVLEVAEREGAHSYDAPGAEFLEQGLVASCVKPTPGLEPGTPFITSDGLVRTRTAWLQGKGRVSGPRSSCGQVWAGLIRGPILASALPVD